MKTKLAVAVVIALSATANLCAGNVSWGVSVGSWGGGVSVGVSSGRGHWQGRGHRPRHGFVSVTPTVVCAPAPVVYAPAPVVVAAPPPVVVAPAPVVAYAPVAPVAPVYYAAPVVYAPAPVVCAPRFGFRARW
jgi:hypothetical protein